MKKSRTKSQAPLISFEGGEGCGKSTQIALLEKNLRKRGFSVQLTREPGGTKLAEKIRELFKAHSMEALTELFLIEAARCEHVEKLIRPALREGKIVLCDRFQESSLVYQTRSGIPESLVRSLNTLATSGLKSSLIFFFDLPIEELRNRLRSRKKGDRFDDADETFHKKTREAYLRLFKKQKRPKVIHIDATQPIEVIESLILKETLRKLG